MFEFSTIVQIAFSFELHRFPLKSISLIALCSIRIIDILMQLDYRSISNGSFGLMALMIGELINLGFVFATLLESIFLLDYSMNQLPQFQFVDELADEGKQENLENSENSQNSENSENLDYTYSDSGYFGDPIDQHRWSAGEAPDDLQPNGLSLQFQHDNERLT